MKKLSFLLLGALIASPALATDYDDEYDTYYDDEPSYSAPAATTGARDTYAGFRIHRNEHIAVKYDVHDGHDTDIADDNFGFGLTIGNRLTDNVKIEFETSYTGLAESKHATKFDYDIWSNMLNVNIYKNFGGAVEPYFGLGIGFSGIWGDAGGDTGSSFDLSFAAMAGVNFALNQYIDLNLGLRYVNYGEMKHDGATAKIDATELYIGAAYKFSIFK